MVNILITLNKNAKILCARDWEIPTFDYPGPVDKVPKCIHTYYPFISTKSNFLQQNKLKTNIQKQNKPIKIIENIPRDLSTTTAQEY